MIDSQEVDKLLPGLYPRIAGQGMSVPNKKSDKHTKAESRKQRTVNRYAFLAKNRTELEIIKQSAGNGFVRPIQSITYDKGK